MTRYPKRVVALDVGERRIGVAVSDPLGITAQGIETIWSKGAQNDLARVREIVSSYDTDRLVVGLPRSMRGEAGYQAERVRAFGRVLEDAGFSVRYQDERLTTVSATRTLLEGDVSRKKRKDVVDMVAATYILQGFLDAGGWKEPLKSVYFKREDCMDGNNNMESGNPIVELFDEDNNKVRFEHLMTVRYKGDDYVLLVPVDDVEDVGEDEVVILRIETTDGEETYVGVEDDDLLENVFNEYLRLAEADEESDEKNEDEE